MKPPPREWVESGMDEDALLAAADLVGRTGARGFEIGYLDDDPGLPHWYAHAQYRGIRVTVEGKADPVEAAEELARQLLRGGRCRRCGKTIRIGGSGKGCCWARAGRRWEPGCGKPIDYTIPSAT